MNLRSLRKTTLAALGMIAAALVVSGYASSAAEQSQSPADGAQVISVTDTYDGKPFEYRILSEVKKNGFRVLNLTYPSPVTTDLPQNNTVPAEYYIPSGVRPGDPQRPAVICLHILDGSFALTQLTCSVLASHGIPAIMFKLPYYGERGLPEGPEAMAADPELFVSAMEQAGHDIKRTFDLLASRPEVDPKLIGITGISLGGITAAAAAGDDPRMHRAALILAGGDLNHLIHYARETRELSQTIKALPPDRREKVEAILQAVDPLTHAPKLRERAQAGLVLMVNAADDTTVPPESTKKLAAALGISDRVVWLEGLGHYTAMAELPSIMHTTTEFFAQDLAPSLRTTPPAAVERTPSEIVVGLVRQLAQFLSEPPEGQCHIADIEVAATIKGKEEVRGRLQYVHGPHWKFKLEAAVPKVGDVAVGQNDHPWMLSGKKQLFIGSREAAGPALDPLTFADPKYAVKLRVVAGAAAGIALAPHVLEQLVSVSDDTGADGRKAVKVASRERVEGALRLTLRDDGETPDQLAFDIEGVKGTLTFRVWRTAAVAHDALFQPPGDVAVQEVGREDVYRMFAALFNFAMENTE